MSAFYDAAAQTALELISANGRALPIARTTRAVDADTNTDTGITVATGTIFAVVLPASKGTIEAFDIRLVDGLTMSQLRYILAAAKDATFVPKPNDVLTFDGDSWRVLGMTPLAPDGTPLLYKMGVQRI